MFISTICEVWRVSAIVCFFTHELIFSRLDKKYCSFYIVDLNILPCKNLFNVPPIVTLILVLALRGASSIFLFYNILQILFNFENARVKKKKKLRSSYFRRIIAALLSTLKSPKFSSKKSRI